MIKGIKKRGNRIGLTRGLGIGGNVDLEVFLGSKSGIKDERVLEERRRGGALLLSGIREQERRRHGNANRDRRMGWRGRMLLLFPYRYRRGFETNALLFIVVPLHMPVVLVKSIENKCFGTRIIFNVN